MPLVAPILTRLADVPPPPTSTSTSRLPSTMTNPAVLSDVVRSPEVTSSSNAGLVIGITLIVLAVVVVVILVLVLRGRGAPGSDGNGPGTDGPGTGGSADPSGPPTA